MTKWDGLKTADGTIFTCTQCGSIFSYVSKAGTKSTCPKCYRHNSAQAVKQRAVNYCGGCCSVCGYKTCLSALEFHHKNPAEKDFNISQNIRKVWSEQVIELDKCILLCANCHRELHESWDKRG